MDRTAADQRARDALAALAQTTSAWQQTHAGATLTAMEDALDSAWVSTRAEVLQAWVDAQPSARVAGLSVEERPRCPVCDVALVAEGRRARTLTLAGEQSLRLEREYARCPNCGQRLFPPG